MRKPRIKRATEMTGWRPANSSASISSSATSAMSRRAHGIDAADWPAHDIERWCNAACFEAGIPYIMMSHFPPIVRVGPLYVPGETRLLRLPRGRISP